MPTASSQSSRQSSSQFSVDLDKGEAPPKGFVRGKTIVLVCAALVIGLLGLNIFSTMQGKKRDDRRANDAAVMWSSATKHTLKNTDTGVYESFSAAKSGDQPTIDSIRRATAELLLTRRNVGDFSVNGKKSLTGREELETALADLEIVRLETASGAEFRYASKKPEVRAALQSWAAAQTK